MTFSGPLLLVFPFAFAMIISGCSSAEPEEIYLDSLPGPQWMLTLIDVDGKQMFPVVDESVQRQPFLLFGRSSDPTVLPMEGDLGCNYFGTRAILTLDGQMTVGNIMIRSEPDCDSYQVLENLFLEGLRRSDHYLLLGAKLTLFHDGGRLVFTRRDS